MCHLDLVILCNKRNAVSTSVQGYLRTRAEIALNLMKGLVTNVNINQPALTGRVGDFRL